MRFLRSQIKKLIRRFTFAINVGILIFGLLFIILGSLLKTSSFDYEDISQEDSSISSSQMQSSLNSIVSTKSVRGDILINVGCSLIASGLLAFVIYPSIENKESLQFQDICGQKGLHDVFINGNIFKKNDEKWKCPKEQLDLITDQLEDLIFLAQTNNVPKHLHIRILTKQPIFFPAKSDELATFSRWVDAMSQYVSVKYYGNITLPYYCRQDSIICLGQQLDIPNHQNRIFYQYDVKGEIGEKGALFFNELWDHGESSLVSNSTYGRSTSKQEDCVQTVLKYFCNVCKKNLGLQTEIEAVVVVWTGKKAKRRTIYSCNKPFGASSHNTREYSMGVVGMLQEQLKSSQEDGSNRANCILLYDKEKAQDQCEYILDWRSGTIQTQKVAVQEWKTKETKAMLAISLFHTKNDVPEVFGALTYDFAETLKGKSEEQRRDLFSHATQCRDMLLPLLATNFEMDYEEQLIQLETDERLQLETDKRL